MLYSVGRDGKEVDSVGGSLAAEYAAMGPDKQMCQQGARGKVKGNILQGNMVSEMSTKQGSLTHKPLDKRKKHGQTKQPDGWRRPETA